MKEIEIVNLHVENTVSLLRQNILKYYDVLNELKRLTLFLFSNTECDRKRIDQWFENDSFGICDGGFWQSLKDLERYREKAEDQPLLSFSCHPDLRSNDTACFRMYAHRGIGPVLEELHSRLPGAAWLYYQDETNIALQNPFIDQKTAIPPDFNWKTYHTWQSVCPENNPDKLVQWTAPTIDYAGEGLIISVSIPVYYNDLFTGVWSIDLKMSELYLDTIFKTDLPEQKNFIVDFQGNIVIHPSIETIINKEKGSIYHDKIDVLGGDFQGMDLQEFIRTHGGHLEMKMANHRSYDVFYKVIPEIGWVYFSTFPKDRRLRVINRKIADALDSVRRGDLTCRLTDLPENSVSYEIVEGFNRMTEALAAQQEQINESQKRLIHSEKLSAIGILAGGIAHDFNNILSSILGFSQLALDEVCEGSSLEDYLTEVYTAGIRAKELVNQILSFARQDEDEMKPIRVDKVLRETLKLLRSIVPVTVEFKCRVNSQSHVLASSINIHQILVNLCTNAAYAMDNFGIVDIELSDVKDDPELLAGTNLNPENTYIRLSVADSGTGIPEDMLESIFEPYFTTKPPGSGTGMGLSVVHGIITRYHGDLIVESSVGKGSRFTVFLPVTSIEKEDIGTQSNHILPKGTGHLLVVDDEKSICNFLEQSLSGLGYTVRAYTNSNRALDDFVSNSDDFDLVITDMTMPGLPGDVFIKKIRQIDQTIPVILCTGFSNTMNKERSQELGINGFFYKPVSLTELAVKIHSVLNSTRN